MPAKPPSPARLGRVIRSLRTARKMSLEALAGEAGISTVYLSGIERGLHNPTWKVIGSVAGGLGLRVSELAALVEEDAVE
jgi:transcriptional regulator with XRE-family HTH domain